MKFLAFDGKVFDTAQECERHEGMRPERLVVGLTAADVEAALQRINLPLAEAFEALGAKIARARRESGELKRARKGNSAPPATAPLAPGSE